MNTIQLSKQQLRESDMVSATFSFWFNGNTHIRSPFPEYIRSELQLKSIDRFHHWLSQLDDKAQKDINDTILGEKLEEIIFEIGMELVHSEDEKITINYPFMVRIGDIISHDKEGESATSEVLDRYIIKDKDILHLQVKLKNKESAEKWETQFELPA